MVSFTAIARKKPLIFKHMKSLSGLPAYWLTSDGLELSPWIWNLVGNLGGKYLVLEVSFELPWMYSVQKNWTSRMTKKYFGTLRRDQENLTKVVKVLEISIKSFNTSSGRSASSALKPLAWLDASRQRLGRDMRSRVGSWSVNWSGSIPCLHFSYWPIAGVFMIV